MSEDYIKYIELLISMSPKSGDTKKMHWQLSDSDPSRYDKHIGKPLDVQRNDRLMTESTLTLNELENDKNFYQFKVISWNIVLDSLSNLEEKTDGNGTEGSDLVEEGEVKRPEGSPKS